MKVYTVTVHHLRVGMKGHNPDPRYIKGDNSREVTIKCITQGYPL